MYAIIIDGRVASSTEEMPAPGSMYMECGEGVAPGWRVQGGALAAPEPEPAPDHNAAIDAQISALEAAQHRATRELLLELGALLPDEARARLAEIDAQIAALRAQRL